MLMRPFVLVLSPMNLDDSHPTSSLSALVPSTAAQDEVQDDDLSDSVLSQYRAEIEQEMCSASPEGGALHGTNEHASDDAMDVDSEEEDVKPMHVKKTQRRVSAKEYYDPELFGLRRSVSRSLNQRCCWADFVFVILIRVGTCSNRAG